MCGLQTFFHTCNLNVWLETSVSLNNKEAVWRLSGLDMNMTPDPHHTSARILTLLYVALCGNIRRKFTEKVIFWMESLLLSKRKLHLFPLYAVLFEKGCCGDMCLLLVLLVKNCIPWTSVLVEVVKDFGRVSKSVSKKMQSVPFFFPFDFKSYLLWKF